MRPCCGPQGPHACWTTGHCLLAIELGHFAPWTLMWSYSSMELIMINSNRMLQLSRTLKRPA